MFLTTNRWAQQGVVAGITSATPSTSWPPPRSRTAQPTPRTKPTSTRGRPTRRRSPSRTAPATAWTCCPQAGRCSPPTASRRAPTSCSASSPRPHRHAACAHGHAQGHHRRVAADAEPPSTGCGAPSTFAGPGLRRSEERADVDAGQPERTFGAGESCYDATLNRRPLDAAAGRDIEALEALTTTSPHPASSGISRGASVGSAAPPPGGPWSRAGSGQELPTGTAGEPVFHGRSGVGSGGGATKRARMIFPSSGTCSTTTLSARVSTMFRPRPDSACHAAAP